MIGNYRPGYAKTRGQYRVRCQVRRRQSRELLHDQIELRKFLARESLAEYRRQRAILLCEQRQVTFRPADVTRKDHRSPRSNFTYEVENLQRHAPRIMGFTTVAPSAPTHTPILS